MDFTTADVEAKVREFAALAPDFTYAFDRRAIECHYYPTEGNPLGCIVGAAFADLGYPITASLEKALGNNSVPYVLEHLGLDPSGWLMDVQLSQDLAHSWGEAVAAADEAVA